MCLDQRISDDLHSLVVFRSSAIASCTSLFQHLLGRSMVAQIVRRRLHHVSVLGSWFVVRFAVKRTSAACTQEPDRGYLDLCLHTPTSHQDSQAVLRSPRKLTSERIRNKVSVRAVGSLRPGVFGVASTGEGERESVIGGESEHLSYIEIAKICSLGASGHGVV